MRPAEFRDYYETLGLQPAASTDDVREAWRRCARLYHPDLNPRKTSFRFQRAKEAYDVLSDPVRRREYDRLYRLRKGVFGRGQAGGRGSSGFMGTPPGARTPPPRPPTGARSGAPRPPAGAQRTTGNAGPAPGRPAGQPGSSMTRSQPPGARQESSGVRSRTSFRPATIFHDVRGGSLIDQIKDAVSQGGASRITISHDGHRVWEAHITSALLDDIARWVIAPLTALLHMMGADQQYQIAITNELIEDYNNANSLYDQGRLEDAKAAYKRCIERDRYFAPAHLSLGAVYEAQRDMPVAVKCYQNAVRADPAGEAGRFARENLRRLRGY